MTSCPLWFIALPFSLHHHIDFAMLLHDLDSDWARVSLQEKAHTAVFYAQVADGELRDSLGEIGPIEGDTALLGVDGDAEAGFEEHED